MSVSIAADATAALAIVKRQGAGRLRHIDVALLWIQQEEKKKRIAFSWVNGKNNPADCLTKPMMADALLMHDDLFNMCRPQPIVCHDRVVAQCITELPEQLGSIRPARITIDEAIGCVQPCIADWYKAGSITTDQVIDAAMSIAAKESTEERNFTDIVTDDEDRSTVE